MPHKLLRLDYLQEVLEQWAKELGVQDLRASKDHSLVGEATAEPSDESVAAMFNPIAMVLANFGTQIPVGSKMKATCQHVSQTYGKIKAKNWIDSAKNLHS